MPHLEPWHVTDLFPHQKQFPNLFYLEDLLSDHNQHIQEALMVAKNTPELQLPSTLLEKMNSFINLVHEPTVQPETLEIFYSHLRGSITSNYFLECAYHGELAALIQQIKQNPAFHGIPTKTLATWVRGGPNETHAAGVCCCLSKEFTLWKRISLDLGSCSPTMPATIQP